MEYTTSEFYGGAITAELPAGLIDASQFRQIPDTQEVWVSTESDDAIIVDLMEKVEKSDSEALEYHLSEISRLNEVDVGQSVVLADAEQVQAKNFPQEYSGVIVVGQEAKKWGRDSTPLVLVLALVRLSRADTDLLVSYNVPFEGHTEDVAQVVQGNRSNPAWQRVAAAKEVVLHVLETLKVEDWGLFG